MELRQLEHFVAVADEKSFTRAAARMQIVQSGLSMSVTALEKELSAKLFTRTAKRVELTSAGMALLPEARRAITAVRNARMVVQETSGLLRGTLQIGTSLTYSTRAPVSRLLGDFHRKFPEICIDVYQGPGERKYDRLSAGKLDLIIGGQPPRPYPAMTTVVLESIPFVLVCLPSHRLAHRSSVSLADIADEPFVDLERDWFTRTLIDRSFHTAGIHRTTRCVVNDMWMLLNLVNQDLGVAVVPATVIGIVPELVTVPFDPDLLPHWELVAAFLGKQPENPAARSFLDMVIKECSGAHTST